MSLYSHPAGLRNGSVKYNFTSADGCNSLYLKECFQAL